MKIKKILSRNIVWLVVGVTFVVATSLTTSFIVRNKVEAKNSPDNTNSYVTAQSTPTSQSSTATNQSSTPTQGTMSHNHIKTVFIILMENHDWSSIYNSPSAPYINKTLLPQSSFTQQYYSPDGIHPSEPNYLWLESGTSFGVNNDGTPQDNHQSSTDHLVTSLDKAGITWKSYQEGISGKDCPLSDSGLYSPRHDPMVYFNNVTNNNDPTSSYCISHIRPFSELQGDLAHNTVAQYNFITPNLCNNMHNSSGCSSSDSVKNGDTWLSEQIPMIMNSQAYKDGGVIFITWDESSNGNQPIGMIVLSPEAKGGGYSNSIHYTHSSTLRTIEEIFNITPYLGDAANSNDLSDLFRNFP